MPNFLLNIAKTNAWRFMVGVLLVFTLIWFVAEAEEKQSIVEEVSTGMRVSVVEVSPIDAPIEVEATGITLARWPTDITASVNGRVISVKEDVLPGRLVSMGSVLAKLQDTFYQSEYAAANARVAEAELNLATNTNRQYVAKTIGKAQSAFGRYEPHVKAAEQNLRAAKAQVKSVQQQLTDTHIAAPFPAVIIAEHVSPGRWINRGDVLFQIAASEFIDIKVELPASSWQRLGDLSMQSKVKVVSPNGQVWQASIRFLSPVMDSVTRQRSLMLEVANPFDQASPLLPDQQVNVTFAGQLQHDVVQAPSSVLTEDGKVWSIVKDGLNLQKLKLEDIEILEERADTLLFRYTENPEKARRLVRFPVSTLLAGQPVLIGEG